MINASAGYFRTMISFVRLTAGDADLLVKIGGASLIESHGHSASAETMQEYVDRSFSKEACRAELADESNLFSAVFYKGEPAGYSKIILSVLHPAVSLQPVTKLERLYLLKNFYNLQLGHLLLQQALDFSIAQNEKGMWLEVWKGNSRAIRFYEKQGFKTIGETEFRLTATHTNPAWIMLLRYESLLQKIHCQ